MRILSLHNRYQLPGGEDVVVSMERELLEANGHCVDLFEVNNDHITNSIEKAKSAVNSIYSISSKTQILQRIASFKPDIVHVHNFFPILSPSVYYACREAAVPVIQTLHNYRLLCLNSYFFREGKVCEDCLGKSFAWPGVVHSCYRGSKTGSAVIGAMQSIHRTLQTWNKVVDVYITVTEFARQKYIQGNLPASKLVVKPNFLYPDPKPGEGQGNYALFVGRLSPEKGLETLLKAWEKLAGKIPLKIVGDGPLANTVASTAQRLTGVEWLGRLPKQEVLKLMKDAQALIFPSLWYEGFPLVIVEAYAVGLPVIASNLGSQSSLVEHGRTGLHFRPGDPEDLVAQVEWALTHPAALAQMRQETRGEFEAKYTAERNYQMLMDIYERVVNCKTF
ncbi:glycosyltransferase family 4 protein [Brasilonema bromeliae]|uniref:Glycosyltransferase family 1 protein n=1 Tax=Brasilonema bromeliae SPC951 TaxID=385972 RepID=A0ABX1P429_9CYAN|nr:glycosyltransferase family 4 protein [Brasilonema bromeliae]NMG19077.1 glycosyltransferase family 1 protein [Brasilonema bromeliae SPC951]